MKIKADENIIKDIDINVIMDIKLYTNKDQPKETYIFGSKFNLNQISNSKMFVDNKEIDLTNYLSNLEDNKEYSIKILLEGNLYNASYMFDHTSDMEIKFLLDFTGKKRNFNKSQIKSTNHMFSHISNLTIDMSIFNCKYVENMDYMFYESNINTLQNFSSFDTSSVLSMDHMFDSAYSSITDLSFLKENKAQSMIYMFHNSDFLSLNLSNFDTSKCEDMYYMFAYCKVTSLDLSSFNTSLVTNMNFMFSHMNLNYINLSSFDTSNVDNMWNMFSYFNISYLDLSSFKTNKVIFMDEMFTFSIISSLDLSSFDLTSLGSSEQMFFGAKFITLNLSLYNFPSSRRIKSMLYNIRAEVLNISYTYGSNIETDMDGIFQELDVDVLDLSNFDTSLTKIL